MKKLTPFGMEKYGKEFKEFCSTADKLMREDKRDFPLISDILIACLLVKTTSIYPYLNQHLNIERLINGIRSFEKDS